MGSFNTTCFASQQTIAPGDECYVLPIYQKSSYAPVAVKFADEVVSKYGVTDSNCYPCAFWTPASGFLEATYADYGNVDIKDTGHNRSRLMHFIRKIYNYAPVVDTGENEAHELGYNIRELIKENGPLLHSLFDTSSEKPKNIVKLDGETYFQEASLVFGQTWDRAKQNRLFLRTSPRGAVTPVQFAIIHKKTFNALITEVEKQKDWENKSLVQRDLFARMLELLQGEVERYNADYKNGGEEQPKIGNHMLASWVRAALGYFGKYEGIYWDYENSAISEIVNVYMRDGVQNTDLLFEKFKPILDGRYVTVGLDMYNIKFSPMVYASQDYDNSIGRAYAKFVQQVSKEIVKLRK